MTDTLDPWGRSTEDHALLDAYRDRLIRERGYVFRPTVDDWCGTFPGGLVGIAHFHRRDGTARIYICGTDDTAMELDVATYDDARQLVLALPVVISMADLAERGFMFA
jgi:hypothetical protein